MPSQCIGTRLQDKAGFVPCSLFSQVTVLLVWWAPKVQRIAVQGRAIDWDQWLVFHLLSFFFTVNGLQRDLALWDVTRL